VPTANDGPHGGRVARATARWVSVNVRREVHAYLAAEDYKRLPLEALARGVSLSRCAADCLAEYFALRREMATALEAETSEQLGTLAPSRITTCFSPRRSSDWCHPGPVFRRSGGHSWPGCRGPGYA
jgi:hypothetical protein